MSQFFISGGQSTGASITSLFNLQFVKLEKKKKQTPVGISLKNAQNQQVNLRGAPRDMGYFYIYLDLSVSPP